MTRTEFLQCLTDISGSASVSERDPDVKCFAVLRDPFGVIRPESLTASAQFSRALAQPARTLGSYEL